MTPLVKQLTALKLLTGADRVLDLGFGQGEDALALAERGYLVDAVDKNPQFSESKANSRIKVHKEDIRNFSIEPGGYDIIIAKNSLSFLFFTKRGFFSY